MNPFYVLPRLLIEVDGRTLAPAFAHALGALRVHQQLSLPTQCELTFDDPPQRQTDSTYLHPGQRLRVTVSGHDEALFAGQVTAVEHEYTPRHGHRVYVRGYDMLHQLRKRQTVRAHVHISLRDLADEMVSDLGLSVESHEDAPLWRRIIQSHLSDLDLLTELAERFGLYLAVRGTVLHLLSLNGMGPTLELTLGKTLLQTRLEVNGDPACRSVEVAAWDPLDVEAYRGSASAARVGRKVRAEVLPRAVGGRGIYTIVEETAQDGHHADAIAQAELDARVAREVTLWGVAQGDPRLQPGACVQISGVADAVAGQYVLSEVTHTIDQTAGFTSEISSHPPPAHIRPHAAAVTTAVVTRIDDPRNLGRVQASLPAYGDAETDWMSVVCVAAGAGKGLVALPDVGDYVLVLLAHEDPAQGVVLGGLYGTRGAPDSGVEDGAVRRYTLSTPGGQRIQLDDAHNRVRVENGLGSYVELSPENVRMHADADLEIEAPGHAITIRGHTVDFERA